MNAESDDTRRSEPRGRGAAKSGGEAAARGTPRNKPMASRSSRYLVAPAGPGFVAEEMLKQLQDFGGIEIVRALAAQGIACPPVAAVRMTPERAVSLRRAAANMLVIENDEPLIAASFAPAPSPAAGALPVATGPGFATTIQVLSEGNEPVEEAEVQLIGRLFAAIGQTGMDGKVTLTLYGELPDSVTDLLIKPRSQYWGLWRGLPQLQPEAVNTATLPLLSASKGTGWGGQAMRFDRLPDHYRGAGIKIALIDSGVDTGHKQLGRIERGFDVAGGEGRAWSQDPSGHGTACAGIIAAAANGMRGLAPDAELHVCKLAADPHSSDLVAAIDYCVAAGIDVACVGFGALRGSAIVEQRIMAAKQRGLAVVAAAGSTGGRIQFPASSRHVLAIGALGQTGTFPGDAPHSVHETLATARGGGFFVPAFSCRGPELDLCAPGVAVISTTQAPDGYAAGDGTSLAAPHVAALAALVLAHHADFRRDFAGRDARRVERLFQILKATAQPLGDPVQTGAGLPDAPMALGLPLQPHLGPPPINVALAQMRDALRFAGRIDGAAASAANIPEPPRGAAVTAQLPLTATAAASAAGARGIEAAMHDLNSAMQLAGLSSGL
jgi:subtilisin